MNTREWLIVYFFWLPPGSPGWLRCSAADLGWCYQSSRPFCLWVLPHPFVGGLHLVGKTGDRTGSDPKGKQLSSACARLRRWGLGWQPPALCPDEVWKNLKLVSGAGSLPTERKPELHLTSRVSFWYKGIYPWKRRWSFIGEDEGHRTRKEKIKSQESENRQGK